MTNSKKVAILIKTNLKFDGRVIAEVDTLAAKYADVDFRIFLLSDGEYEPVNFQPNISVEVIKVFTRNFRFKRYLLPLTILIYSVSCFLKVLRFRPDVVHVHDIFPLPIAYLYTRLFSPFLIYDDHELFKDSPDLFHRGLYWLENRVMKRADRVLIANEHRARIVRWIYKIPSDRLSVMENFNHIRSSETTEFRDQTFLNLLEDMRSRGLLSILHQGQVSTGRGLDYLLEVARYIAGKARIIFMGISDARYQTLILEHPILEDTTVNIGYKPYSQINEYWSRVDASLVFYSIAELNNRYCAPNRLYLALSNKKPLLVNAANPVLSTAVLKYGAGLCLVKSDVQATLTEFLTSVKEKRYYQSTERTFTFKTASAPVLLEVYEEALR